MAQQDATPQNPSTSTRKGVNSVVILFASWVIALLVGGLTGNYVFSTQRHLLDEPAFMVLCLLVIVLFVCSVVWVYIAPLVIVGVILWQHLRGRRGAAEKAEMMQSASADSGGEAPHPSASSDNARG
jgi:hypothetical protein